MGVGLSGAAQSANVVGSALFAVPATAIVYRRGRRPSLAAGYLVAALGALIVFLAALLRSGPVLFLGFFLFGGSTAATFQARYAAVDLAPAALRGRHLSLIVWGTTLGAVIGPSLAAAAGTAVARYGAPTIAGPFFFSALLFALATLLLVLLLRPDPAVVAREVTATSSAFAAKPEGIGMRAALRVVAARTSSRLGVSAMATGHLVMIGVMAMTPVHIRGAGHDAAHTLRIVGVVLSLHIAGMFAFAPLMGWLTDRLGRRPVIVGGIALLLVACAVAGTAGHGSVQLAVGMMLLGLGWSATMVAGSTLLTESVRDRAPGLGPGPLRPHHGPRRRDRRSDLGRDRRGMGLPQAYRSRRPGDRPPGAAALGQRQSPGRSESFCAASDVSGGSLDGGTHQPCMLCGVKRPHKACLTHC